LQFSSFSNIFYFFGLEQAFEKLSFPTEANYEAGLFINVTEKQPFF